MPGKAQVLQFVPISRQAWKFCKFWEPGSEPKKIQEPKKRGRKRKEEKGRE